MIAGVTAAAAIECGIRIAMYVHHSAPS